MMNRVKIVSIEGNIGSGKSTFLKNLKTNLPSVDEKYKIIFVDEPVSLWENIKDVNGKNMIEKFYENPKKYAFPFQIMAFTTRLIYLKKSINDALNDSENNGKKIIIITERSLHTDCYVFAELLKNQENIEDVCFQIYMQLFNEFSLNYPINSLIYIDTTPEICYERIKTRSRSGEEIISLDYLTECHYEHETYIHTKMERSNKIVIDGTFDVYENPDILEEWLEIVKYCIDEII
jgi:deoxyadenosine/deoxycytidine kinase